MTTRARAYRTTHMPPGELTPVLPGFHAFTETRARTGDGSPELLARAVHLPIATTRGALSSFSESHPDREAVRVCAGTSCMLAGGAEVSRDLSRQHKCESVYCLGYCDRSPAAMSPGGRVVTGYGPDRFSDLVADRNLPHPAPPSIRCIARHAIVTERLCGPLTVDPPVPDYSGLSAALELEPEKVIDAVVESGVRGRGGAAYPTGNKWRLAARAPGVPKFVVANGDEGDPGSFIDRELMERDPHAILEGMAICAHAVGASRGVVFIRSEYPVAAAVMSEAIADATSRGILGDQALGRGRPFHVEVVRGMGSYVCGEETALLAAIEGQRGEVWPRPPYPVEAGLFGKPTVVDNVETLVNIPWVISHGPAAYRAMGTPESGGTKAICLNQGFARPGIIEVEFGISLRELIEKHAGGGAGGRELEAVLIGGPMGSIVLPDKWDTPVCFLGMARRGINLGHAGLVAIPKPADWAAILRHLLTFMRDESCGKCVPCRLGSARAREMAGQGLTSANLPQFQRILALMKDASLCAFGRETPGPIRTILENFGRQILAEVKS